MKIQLHRIYRQWRNLAIATLTTITITASAQTPVKGPHFGQAPNGLDNRVIALWPSHGNYYNNDQQQWMWQRAHLLQTIEDLFSSSYVVDLLAPMLENAGAYVMMPRERDTNLTEIIIDADSPLTPGYSETSGRQKWSNAGPGYAYTSPVIVEGQNPMTEGSSRTVKAVSKSAEASTAVWRAAIPRQGVYTIYVSYPSSSESTKAATYTVRSLRGEETYTVDQTMGGGVWMRLGEFPLAQSDEPVEIVTLTNVATGVNVGKNVGADAVRIGGGVGNVSREGTVSGRPRWTEGARYFLQYSGCPETVYAASDTGKDYADDFGSRPRWVNYLAGKSSKIPNSPGLGIPIDLSIALHTDAGVTPDSTIIGTLGIYSTDGGTRLGDGRRRTTNRALTESVVNSIVDDIRALYYPEWTKRKIRDRKYAEARIPLVPSTLIESFSHQNLADMRLAQDPAFRFDLARAIYKGILRYLAPAKQKTVIQPLPVNSMMITNNSNGRYTLSWKPTADPLEPTASPTRYIVERRLPGGDFTPWKTVSTNSIEYTATEGEPVDLRVVAVNNGGRSFPSEVMSLCHYDNGNPEVLIVNGFTRISAPESFDTGDEAGFLDDIDSGVPYIRTLGYSGKQTDFAREHPWVDDIIDPGFGASESTYDGIPVAGNTFDYPAQHGRAIAAAGYPYISVSLKAYEEPTNRFNSPIVDLILGKQREINPLNANDSTRFKSFSPELQTRIATHKLNGGSLMVSGALIGSDLILNPYSNDSTLTADIRFANDVLLLELEQQFATENSRVTLLPFWGNNQRTAQAQFSNRPNEQLYVVDSPDAISSTHANAIPIIRFADSNLYGGFVAAHGNNSTAILSIPFESIVDQEARFKLMASILTAITTVRQPSNPEATVTFIPYGQQLKADKPNPDPTHHNLRPQ